MNEESIFAAAIKMADPARRRAYLDRVCGGDPALRADVEELLHASDDAGSFLDRPPLDLHANVANERKLKKVDDAGQEMRLMSFLTPCDQPGRLGKLSGMAGEYEVIEVVGEGGMGVVLRAYDTKLSRIVAVKVIAPELASKPAAVKRFVREAQAAAAVHHDHVITIHAIDDTHRPPFLVMQFVHGKTLQQKLESEGPFQLKQILRICSQIADGLKAAHACGLIHRDVKPANILLENGVERVKITDFGLARSADDLEFTKAGQVPGTPQFMSPEQARGAAIDIRSDLFSLGSVLYTMCTGRPPFRAENAMAIMHRVCHDTPRPIHEVNSEIPRWLEAIVNKLLCKDPNQRVQTATEVSDLLNRCLAHVQNPDLHPSPPTLGGSELVDRQAASQTALPAKVSARPRVIVGLTIILPLLGLLFTEAIGVSTLATAFRRPAPKVSQTPSENKPRGDQSAASELLVAPFDVRQAKLHQQAVALQIGGEVEFVNSLGMKLQLIPAGQFAMGSPDSDENAGLIEKPAHQVTIAQPFYLGTHEVTVAQFEAYVDATQAVTDAEQDQRGSWLLIDLPHKGREPDWTWRSPGFEQDDQHPVCCVSWQDAQRFCAWLSSKERKSYGLPTEAQWEYACRGGTATRFHMGAYFVRSEMQVNAEGTAPVGSFAPNPFGLYDMHGDVYEWCRDGRRAYGLEPVVDPVGPMDDAEKRLVRGGAWSTSPITKRNVFSSAARYVTCTPDYAFRGLGFRVVLATDQPNETTAKSSGRMLAE